MNRTTKIDEIAERLALELAENGGLMVLGGDLFTNDSCLVISETCLQQRSGGFVSICLNLKGLKQLNEDIERLITLWDSRDADPAYSRKRKAGKARKK